MADGNNMVVGRFNDETMPTVLSRHGGEVVADAFMVSNDTFGNAIRAGAPGGTAVDATTLGGVGLNASASTGVAINATALTDPGIAMLAQAPRGVEAFAQEIAVFGVSSGLVGVGGISSASASRTLLPAGVMGDGDNCPGVVGSSSTEDGVEGFSAQATGTFGSSVSGCGVFGNCQDGPGVAGESMTNVGVYGRSLSGFAGVFDGPVTVNGSFTVTGAPKSCAVKHPDGSLRRLYCMESPESWFEDFGEARLVKGVAKVEIDPQFAALVDTRSYHVFVTSNGPAALYVRRKGRNGFEICSVPDRPNGTSPGRKGASTCSYRIVARRKGWSGKRLERVRVPDSPHKKLSGLRRSFGNVNALRKKLAEEASSQLSRLKELQQQRPGSHQRPFQRRKRVHPLGH